MRMQQTGSIVRREDFGVSFCGVFAQQMGLREVFLCTPAFQSAQAC
jgi:hypothetical protein